jgi:teichuronic acid biosynthesis glycosyltransferase TuaH
LGPIAPDDLAHRLVHFGVGLTPYADTSFNRASFPLKTLEYLAAGVPVVSTDMPAARWLNSEHVTISEDAEAFARHVTEVLSQPENESQRQSRRDFAAGHSWVIRAKQFLELLKPSHAEEPVQSKREP